MRLRDTIIWVVCLILAVVLLITAGSRLDYINSQRVEMRLISNDKPLENAPPSLAFATVAMGAFRGLLVDVLWMRADKLKEEGQFFDAKQLAEWITTLQPRFASVWEFQAWNMAYNISVCLPATQPQERWRWIKNGCELLRDQGIPLNPRSILLYHELARIIQHKMGGIADDAHKYYKLQWAMAMEPLLGPADNRYFKLLAQAPTEWEQIVNDPNITQLIAALKSADVVFAEDSKFVSNYLSLRQNPARFKPAAFNVIDNFRGTQALEKFDIFAKAYQLRKTWKLDPVLMEELNKLYGPVDLKDPNMRLPLDWRHPDAHAIYWAVKGLRVAGKKGVRTAGEEKYSADEINTDRIVVHSLQNLFRNGKMFICDSTPREQPSSDYTSPPQLVRTKEVFLRPDLRMFDSYNKAIIAVIEKYTDPKRGQMNSHQIGHKNMLKNAIFSFYQAGHRAQAERVYEQLRTLYPADEFKVPLVIFAKNRLHEELKNIVIDDAKELILMMLREGYFNYAVHDDDEAFGREKMAQEVYDHYNAAYTNEIRIDLPEFKLLRYFALCDFFNDQQYPVELRYSLLGRIKNERPQLAEQLKEIEAQLLKEKESK